MKETVKFLVFFCVGFELQFGIRRKEKGLKLRKGREEVEILKQNCKKMKFDLNAPNPISPFRQIPTGRILERTIQDRLPFSSHVSLIFPFYGENKESRLYWIFNDT